MHRVACAGLILFATPALSLAQIQTNDAVIAHNNTNPATTLELVRGVTVEPDSWATVGAGFIQYADFDNSFGWSNGNGNLIGVNRGANAAAGGSVHNFATQGAAFAAGTTQLSILNTGAGNPFGVTQTQLDGVSFAQNNSRMSMTGVQSNRLLVFNYNAGGTPGQGAGASVTGLSTPEIDVSLFGGPGLNTGDTEGTAWIGSTSVLVATRTGTSASLTRINGVDTAVPTGSVVQTFTTQVDANTVFDIEHNSDISPFVFVAASAFSGGTSFNSFLVLDSATFAILDSVNQDSISLPGLQTSREINVDSNGNVVAVGFGGTLSRFTIDGTGQITNYEQNYFDSATNSNFNGVAIAVTASAVPEPTTMALGGVGMMGLAYGVKVRRARRRKASAAK